jgi:hypothetical protein
MKSERNTLEMSLSSVRLEGSDPEAAERLVLATLLWPRPMISERISSRVLSFRDGAADLGDKDWTERILFKETVEGTYGLVVQVTEPMSAQQVARFFRQMGEALLKLTATEAGKQVSGFWLGALARIPLQILAGEVGDTGKGPKLAAAGRITLQPGESGNLQVPLQAVSDQYRTEVRRVGSRRITRRVKTVSAGDPAGDITLQADYYKD